MRVYFLNISRIENQGFTPTKLISSQRIFLDVTRKSSMSVEDEESLEDDEEVEEEESCSSGEDGENEILENGNIIRKGSTRNASGINHGLLIKVRKRLEASISDDAGDDDRDSGSYSSNDDPADPPQFDSSQEDTPSETPKEKRRQKRRQSNGTKSPSECISNCRVNNNLTNEDTDESESEHGEINLKRSSKPRLFEIHKISENMNE
jgi:hypothetical protein